jgi:signal transduction histidine kinase/CheY-like chemotaxis protein
VNETAEIRADRVAATLGQTPLAVTATLINAALMVAVMAPLDERWAHLLWFLAMVAIGAVRLAVWRRHFNDPHRAERAVQWGRASALSSALAGLGWGLGLVLLWPPGEAGQLFWAFLLCGMCAGAAAVHAAHLATAMAFILPCCLPLAVAFIAAGTDRSLVAAAMTMIFVVTLWVSVYRSSRLFGDYIGARHALAHQAAALDAANASLREEMALHRATEASLRHAQKMEAVGRLTGGIAHDFNNLLTAVLGSIALLEKRLPELDPRAARLLANARKGAERGAALTQRLLVFGRRQALHAVPVELPALLAGMSELLRGSLGGAIRLETCLAPELPPVLADANQLELAILNLALNARDAMPLGGTITISAEPRCVTPAEELGLAPGAYVVILLADTGAGMDEATLARAMEPFFTTKEVGKGTGLGLSMVHGMAAQSGGRLTLQSRPGEGTTAALWLPRAPAAAAPGPVPPQRRGGGGIVLLVDDDPLVLGSTAEMLEDLGYRVRATDSGGQALEVLRGGARVDLLLADDDMPGMAGAALAAEARRLRPGLPVLIAGGQGTPVERAASGLPRLAKPLRAEALALSLAGLVTPDGAA